jgi:hypothetical protein
MLYLPTNYRRLQTITLIICNRTLRNNFVSNKPNSTQQNPPWGFQLVEKFTKFYGTRRIIPAFSRQSWARSRQSISLSHFLKIHFNTTLPPTLSSSKCFSSSGFPSKTLYAHLVTLIGATFRIHFLLLDLVTWKIFGEDCKLWSASFCSLFHCPITWYFLGQNILLITLFLNTVSLRSSFSVSNHVSHQYKT